MSQDKNKKYHLYILQLEEGKYYIGITSKTPQERFHEHRNGFCGAEWTKLYKPIRIEQTKDLGITTYERAELFENKVVREYIKKYGLDNVRGGNITYRGKMVKRFGYVWRFDDWDDIVWYSLASVWMLGAGIYIALDWIFRH